MRKKKADPKFNFILMCNKICGTAHFKMKMIVVVLPKKEYQIWKTSKQANTFKNTYLNGEAEESSNTKI